MYLGDGDSKCDPKIGELIRHKTKFTNSHMLFDFKFVWDNGLFVTVSDCFFNFVMAVSASHQQP